MGTWKYSRNNSLQRLGKIAVCCLFLVMPLQRLCATNALKRSLCLRYPHVAPFLTHTTT